MCSVCVVVVADFKPRMYLFALHCTACGCGANALCVVLAMAPSHQQHTAAASRHIATTLGQVYCLLHPIVLPAGVVLTPCVLYLLWQPAISSTPQAPAADTLQPLLVKL
jgi:hypothetical protein